MNGKCVAGRNDFSFDKNKCTRILAVCGAFGTQSGRKSDRPGMRSEAISGSLNKPMFYTAPRRKRGGLE
ncbi:hypothetical protein DRA42_11820 [Ethanoligenens harbinense]|nr:hypothetical protein CXQ68_11785 [Ethanoligenens harbinense YUAN-3]AYF39489.1 hypothetical protein CXP51_11680 [Ethanoligenens harbinense]AYF42314.1 hypothetical protein CN246_12230 [Ethanoligenens harbinense]QCN93068.1 hypothetical protein DRA42_11820 [Ethanoligenens harbinense]